METVFQEPLKVKKFCINPQPHDLDSRGFDLVRDWIQKNTQDLLNDIFNGAIYDMFVRDRYQESREKI